MTRRTNSLAADEDLKAQVLAILRTHGMGDYAGRAAWPALAEAFEAALDARAQRPSGKIIHPEEWR